MKHISDDDLSDAIAIGLKSHGWDKHLAEVTINELHEGVFHEVRALLSRVERDNKKQEESQN